MIEVTAEQVVSTLREVVAERPDFVYSPPEAGSICKYVHDGPEGEKPGCVVGHVMNRLGVPLSELRKHEGTAAHALIETLLSFPTDDTTAQARTKYLVNSCQRSQDSMLPWGEALWQAENSTGWAFA